ncbi:MAG: hypothetical protein QM775_29555 [Pirellulales bacterium]
MPTMETLAPSKVADRAEMRPYLTLQELRRGLTALESCPHITVVLVLDKRFSGHLASLIERRRPGMRLVLVAASGRLSGGATVADLAATGGALGWQQIVMERDEAAAIAESQASLLAGERLVVFHPSWR